MFNYFPIRLIHLISFTFLFIVVSYFLVDRSEVGYLFIIGGAIHRRKRRRLRRWLWQVQLFHSFFRRFFPLLPPRLTWLHEPIFIVCLAPPSPFCYSIKSFIWPSCNEAEYIGAMVLSFQCCSLNLRFSSRLEKLAGHRAASVLVSVIGVIMKHNKNLNSLLSSEAAIEVGLILFLSCWLSFR